MPMTACPWCASVIDAPLAVALTKEHERDKRVSAADAIADALWTTTSELESLLNAFNRSWGDVEKSVVERHLAQLTQALESLRRAQRSFASRSSID